MNKNKKPSNNSPKVVLENKLPRYIIGAFSIVAAMAWNEYVKEQMESKIKNKTKAKFLYAITATIILVLAVFVIHKVVDWYLQIKDKTDKVVHDIICHKNGQVYLNNLGHIHIKRVATKKLIWNFDNLQLNPNNRYDILINVSEPLRLTMMTNKEGNLLPLITYDWELDELMGNYLDFKDYKLGYIYTGVVMSSKH